MRISFFQKEQPVTYSYQTYCYDKIQIIVVEKGQLNYTFSDIEGIAEPWQLLVLPEGAAFKLYCSSQSYEGLGVFVDNAPHGLFDEEAHVFNLDAQLKALSSYLLCEIKNPKPDFDHDSSAIASLFLKHVLALFKQQSSSRNDANYWARKVQRVIERNVYNNRCVADCLKGLGLSYRQLARHFVSVFEQSPKRYQLIVKLQESQRILRSSNSDLSSIAYELGFSSLQHFSFAFKGEFGISPNKFRQQMFDETAKKAESLNDSASL